ncbi:hypothetical protein ABO04_04365 [Nitrosomonas sp. HPC101]|nr:hypothetical protein [Nitrosomonas sp. HPC101]
MYKKDAPFSMVFPALIAIVLVVPFVMNFLAHAWLGEKRFPPLVMMKLPADSSIITLPQEIKQFKPFEVTLRLDTKALALRISDVVRKSLPGTELQNIHGEVFPEMRAGIMGDTFSIDPPEPQIQLFSGEKETHWSWIVTPEKEGHYALSLKLYLQTTETTREHPQIVDLAEIQLFVKKNSEAWMRTYGIWYAVPMALIAGWWWKKYRIKKRNRDF